MKVITTDSGQGEKLLTIDSVSTEKTTFKLVADDVEIVISYVDETVFPTIYLREAAAQVDINQNVKTTSIVKVETEFGKICITTNFTACKSIVEKLMGAELRKGSDTLADIAQVMKSTAFVRKAKGLEKTVSKKCNVIAIQKAACMLNGAKSYRDISVLVKGAKFDKAKEKSLLAFLKEIELEKSSVRKSQMVDKFLLIVSKDSL
ncbi:MAG: hypothetical protein VX100_02545 [Pseudomonadota bacterium]|nr:hypothetical protein [Pseudomonadota bacterium]